MKLENGSTLRSGLRTQEDGWRGSRPDTGANGAGVDPATYFDNLSKIVAPLRERLLNHFIYTEVNSPDRLREFMRIHVFAVWDFISLVKRIQSELTIQRLPYSAMARIRELNAAGAPAVRS